MIAPSATRVQEQTSQETNARVHKQTEMNIAYYTGHPELIDQRLDELDQEWDIERCLQVSASGVSLAGFIFSILRGRTWLLLTLAAQGFLLQHAIQGWCPPMPLLRSLGFRTRREIETERHALKALRGDFKDIEQSAGAATVLEALSR